MQKHPALSAGIMAKVPVFYSQRCEALDTTQKCLLTKDVPSWNYIHPIGVPYTSPYFVLFEDIELSIYVHLRFSFLTTNFVSRN